MREARLVELAVFPPGTCFGCGGSEGPMVDTMVDVVGEGRIYVCTRICLPAWAGLAGCATPEQVAELGERLDEAIGAAAELDEQLTYEREHKVVAVSDMLALVDRRDAVSTPVGIRVNGEQAAVNENFVRCSAIRADGEPCTAPALSGRDVCLAHSKRTVAA